MYIKQGLKIVTLFTLLSSVTTHSGKALYFLQNPSIEGDPPKSNDGYQDPYTVDSAAAHKVLFGHYSAFLENANKQSKDKDPLIGRSLINKPVTEANKVSKLSKVVEIYRKNLYLTVSAAVNITTASQSEDFLSQLESCRSELKRCDELGDEEIICGVKCLGQGNDVFSGLTEIISTLVNSFCSPIDTIFDKFFEVKGKLKHPNPNLRQYWLFLKRCEEAKKPWVDVAAQGAAYLVPVIIDRIKTNMMPFRLFNQKLETELKAEELLHPGANSESMILNSLCQNVDDADIAENLLDVLYRDPVLIDIILGGLASMNLVSKYLPGRFQVPFAASAEALRIMTGSVCGLIEFAETGQVPSCDQIGGFPVPGVPLPEIPEMPILNQECLQGSAVNGPENGDVVTAANPLSLPQAAAPPAGRKKRNVLPRKIRAITNIDGANLPEENLQLAGYGSAEVRKRSLVVGERRRQP